MQAQTPKSGAAEATTNRYDTIVIRGAKGQTVPKEVDGGEVVAWSRGHELAAMDALEEFVDDVASGDCSYPAELTSRASQAMDLMERRRELGWDADEPELSWSAAISKAKHTAIDVFDGCHDDARQAIEYLSELLLVSTHPEPAPKCSRCDVEALRPWSVDPHMPWRILAADGRPVAAVLGGGHERPFSEAERKSIAAMIAKSGGAA
jgi:hypothetical protein